MFTEKIKPFSEFVVESDNNTESMKNYKNYLAGKEPLRHCFLTHREGDGLYDFVKKSMNKKMKSASFDKTVGSLQKTIK